MHAARSSSQARRRLASRSSWNLLVKKKQRSVFLMASANNTRQAQKDAADQNFDYMFKLLIIGNSSVGKTSFLFCYADDSFTSAIVSTMGIDFKVKMVYRNEKRVKLQIWVSARKGRERQLQLSLAFAGREGIQNLFASESLWQSPW
ncbi:ras-related protein Rab-3C-like [Gopherus flavomarginatus]|uniref:ras-related protein Rab-3C-like n=1 Tax=Gopherus flavomarginatus TaxID=286002 RepID=UPI0021CC212E|nr:ras-related protein Rab-3C-like [Gopherus flavomarginatus]